MALFDHVNRSGQTIIVDDSTGTAAGYTLSNEMTDALKAANLETKAPGRGKNGSAGN